MALTRQPVVTIQDILNAQNTTPSTPSETYQTYDEAAVAPTQEQLTPTTQTTDNTPPPVTTPPATITPVVDPFGWKNDFEYKNKLTALDQALTNYKADQAAQKARYATSYDTGLQNLGWTWDNRPDDKTLEDLRYDTVDKRWETGDDSTTPGAGTPVDVRGQFSQSDRNTASGRSFTNQLEDFASRGMLQSSAFAQAKDDLSRQLLEQAGGIQNARRDYWGELTRGLNAFNTQDTTDRNTAMNEAIARFEALNGLGSASRG